MNMPSAASSEGSSGLSIRRSAAAVIVSIDCPDAESANSTGIIEALAGALEGVGRDPMIYGVIVRSATPGKFACARHGRPDKSTALAAVRAELSSIWRLECFSKPIVSLIDSAVSGPGVGLTTYGTHRVAGEGYSFSTPQTATGTVPDCAILHALSRMPHAIGRYLALTGHAIGAADAFALGLVTHCIPSAQFDAIEALVAEAEPLDPVLDSRHVEPGASPLLARGTTIARFFETSTVSETLGRLREANGADRSWAQSVLAELEARPPRVLDLTDLALRRAASLDIRQTLQQDFRVAHWLAVHPATAPAEFGEPASMLENAFASLGADELALPCRSIMQGGRG